MEPLNLNVLQYCDLKTPFPKFSKPTACGYYSLSQERHYEESLRQLKYLPESFTEYPKNVKFNLKEQYARRHPNPAVLGTEKLDHLLHFILTHKETVFTHNPPDVVCSRSLLQTVMHTPYDIHKDWQILAMKYKGSIYLYEEPTERDWQKEQMMTKREKRHLSYEFKFNQFVLTDAPGMEQNENSGAPVNEGEEFRVLFRSKLGHLNLLYDGKLDGVVSNEPVHDVETLSNATFATLKLKQAERRHDERHRSAKVEMLKWWSQCFLAGIEQVVVGVRNKKGVCEETLPLRANNIHRQVREIDPNLWKPVDCMTFLLDFLTKVQSVMIDVDSPVDVFKFTFAARGNFTVGYEKFHGRNAYTFLPYRYCDSVDKILVKSKIMP